MLAILGDAAGESAPSRRPTAEVQLRELLGALTEEALQLIDVSIAIAHPLTQSTEHLMHETTEGSGIELRRQISTPPQAKQVLEVEAVRAGEVVPERGDRELLRR